MIITARLSHCNSINLLVDAFENSARTQQQGVGEFRQKWSQQRAVPALNYTNLRFGLFVLLCTTITVVSASNSTCYRKEDRFIVTLNLFHLEQHAVVVNWLNFMPPAFYK